MFHSIQTCSSIHYQSSRGAALIVSNLFMHGCKICSQNFLSCPVWRESSRGSLAPWQGFSVPAQPSFSEGNWSSETRSWVLGGKKSSLNSVSHSSSFWWPHIFHGAWYMTICFVPPGRKSDPPTEWAVRTFTRNSTSDLVLYLFYQTRNTIYIVLSTLTKPDSSLYPSAKPLASRCASLLTTSQLCTSTRVGEWDPALGEIPALDPERVPPQSSWGAEVCLSFIKASSSENPLLQKKPKRTLKGGRSSFNLCWGINWAFRWAERPWIWKDEKEKNQRGEWKCSHLPGCGKGQGGRGKVSDAFSGPSLMFFSRNELLQNTGWLPLMPLKGFTWILTVTKDLCIKLTIRSWHNYSEQMTAWWEWLDCLYFLN